MHTDFQCPVCGSIALNHAVELCIEDTHLAQQASYPTLAPGTLFTVRQYQYTTFESGTDIAARRKWGSPPPPGGPGTPWAFPHPAVIAAKHLQFEKPKPAFELSFGDVVDIPEYGLYSIERDHNRNVKFVAIDLGDRP